MSDAAPSFIHRFLDGSDPTHHPLLLLHGTGGNEDDLVPIGEMVDPAAALLSPRGKVMEGGMPRFFRRLAEGVFDYPDVIARANELADFVASETIKRGLKKPIAIGFSNGANIAAAMLYLRPEVLAGAVLIRAMLPLPSAPEHALDGMPVMLLSGRSDPILPLENARQLAGALREKGAVVDHRVLETGHGMTRNDIDLARGFVAGLNG
jgi:phospholipase/carboxylesterase